VRNESKKNRKRPSPSRNIHRPRSIETTGHRSFKFQVQSSKKKAVSSTLNLEL
jgi:hypothetical protein